MPNKQVDPLKIARKRKRFLKRKVKLMEPKFIYINDRDCLNKTLYYFYKFFRGFYASIWFYFVPFATIFASYYIPYSKTDDPIVAEVNLKVSRSGF